MKISKSQEQQQDMRWAFQSFLNKYSELLASFDRQQIADALSSYAALGNLDEMFHEEPGIPVYLRYNEEAFLTLYDREAITLVTPLTELGEKQLEQMRRATGIGVEELPPTPAPKPTAQQILDEKVVKDWNTLKVADFKRNCANDRGYRATFERLSAEDKLGSGVATFQHRITEGGTITSRS